MTKLPRLPSSIISQGPIFALLAFTVLLFGAQAVFADPVCVTAEHAMLRKGPGSQFPVEWVVGQYMPLFKTGQKGIWAEVQDLDGETHWVTSAVISGRINCVVVKTKTAALHTAADPRSPASELALVDRYTPFKKIERDDAWIQVQDEYKTKSWIHETNVWIPVIRSKVSF